MARPPAGPPRPHGARPGPYLRPVRVQPRRGPRGRILTWVLIATALLFVKVWERTLANSLAMERDRLTSEVRGLTNRVRISQGLVERAALEEGLELTSLRALGFDHPNPGQVVEIEFSRPALAAGGSGGRLLAPFRRIAESLGRRGAAGGIRPGVPAAEAAP